MKKFIVIFGVIVLLGLVAGGIYYLFREPPEQNLPETQIPETKTYRNEEFGFEFQYPKNWSFHANTFYSPFSKFNLVGASPEEKYRPDPLAPSLLVNIVTPDFADRAFYDIKNIALEISVAGVTGSKYEYDYEGLPKIAIILPLGQYKMILGVKKLYEDVFNQVISTFKFLK